MLLGMLEAPSASLRLAQNTEVPVHDSRRAGVVQVLGSRTNRGARHQSAPAATSFHDAASADPSRGSSGLALVCSEHGSIRRTIWDDVGATRQVAPGDDLVRLVRPADAGRAVDLLERIRGGAVVSDYDLYLVLPPSVVRFKFFGCRFGAASLLLVGSTSRSRLVRLFEQLLRTSSEQGATLRALLEDCHRRLQEATERNALLFHENVRLRDEIAWLRLEAPRARAAAWRGSAARRAASPEAGGPARDARTALRAIVEDRGCLTRDLACAGYEDAARGVGRVADLAASLLDRLEARDVARDAG
jgi:hypothetical protein